MHDPSEKIMHHCMIATTSLRHGLALVMHDMANFD